MSLLIAGGESFSAKESGDVRGYPARFAVPSRFDPFKGRGTL